MSCRSILRSAAVIAVAGACAVLFANLPSTHAQQLQVLGASPPAQDSAPEMTVSKRLILHDITTRGLAVDPDSRPVLDYAVQLLRQYPATRVYLSGQGSPATAQRQAQAVAQYLQRRGIAANRLIVQDAGAAQTVAYYGSSKGVIVLNLTTPCGSCSSDRSS